MTNLMLGDLIDKMIVDYKDDGSCELEDFVNLKLIATALKLTNEEYEELVSDVVATIQLREE